MFILIPPYIKIPNLNFIFPARVCQAPLMPGLNIYFVPGPRAPAGAANTIMDLAVLGFN